jgi:methylmalonyl-CoA/ethylmalonyl-CoA epimerase
MRAMFECKVDHVAIAVRDVGDAVPFWVDALGARFLFAGERADQGFRWAQFAMPGGGKIELVTPTDPDGFVGRFIQRRGEGVHHVTLKVDDIYAAVAHLGKTGIPLFNVNLDDDGWKEAFIHPRDADGTLVQLAQSALSDEELATHHLQPHLGSDHLHLGLKDLVGPSADSPREADNT